MDFDFSTLITDRSPSDLELLRNLLSTPMEDWTAEQLAEFNLARSKGAYNYTDLNRVTAAMEYLVEQLNKYRYSVDYQKIEIQRPETSLLPEGFTELEYIKSSGSQYINTEIDPNNNMEIVIDMQLDSDVTADCNPFSVYGTTNRFFTKYTNNKFQAGLGTTWFKETGYSGDVHERLILKLGNGYFTVEDTSVKVTDSEFTVGRPLYIFASNNKGNATGFTSMILYSCKITENEELIRDYKPCIDQEKRVGLYDIISNVFVPNSGSGVFIAGPEIPKIEPKDPYLWYEEDIPTLAQMERYLLNVVNIYNVLLSNPELPATMAQLDYNGANQIEEAMLLVEETIERVVKSMCRSNAFTFWSGNRPLPSAESDLGRTWKELDSMNTAWRNWQVADWYLLLYGNLKAEGVVK